MSPPLTTNSGGLKLIAILEATKGLFALLVGLGFIEAYGLWRGYRWTEWFALLSGAIYMPFEVYEAFTHSSLISLLVLVINTFIILYMLKVVMKKHHASA